MTHYYDAWLESLANRDRTIMLMVWMALSLVGAWMLYIYLIPWLDKNDMLIIPKSWLPYLEPVIMAGGLALYWGTIIYSVMAP